MKSDHEQPNHFKERRSKRHTVASDATLQNHHCYKIEVTIRDVSQCGFMADCADCVQIGSHISLDVPGIGPVDAQVRWQVGGRMGGMFQDPISLSRCEWTAIPVDSPKQAA